MSFAPVRPCHVLRPPDRDIAVLGILIRLRRRQFKASKFLHRTVDCLESQRIPGKPAYNTVVINSLGCRMTRTRSRDCSCNSHMVLRSVVRLTQPSNNTIARSYNYRTTMRAVTRLITRLIVPLIARRSLSIIRLLYDHIFHCDYLYD